MFISKALKTFIIVYETNSIKEAADKLCLTIPPVSRMIKLMESWLDTKLFIIEKNRVTPTINAQRLYGSLYPHYCAINSLFENQYDDSFVISSPYINSAFMTEILQPCILGLSVSLRNDEFLHDNDDLYISLTKRKKPNHFSEDKISIIQSLCYTEKNNIDWRELPLLIETTTLQNESFNRTLLNMKSQGFSSKIITIDNPSCLFHQLQNGDGLSFTANVHANAHGHKLPFSYIQEMYLYANKIRYNKTHDTIINYIRERN